MSEKPNVKRRKWESLLPDEISISIFTRLEPKDVLRCRCVVKSWRDLTSTPYFLDLHKQHGMAHHMILVDKPEGSGYCRGNFRDQFFLDEWWIRSTQRNKPPVQKVFGYPLCQSVFSQDGLLVLESGCVCCDQIVIVNPIFREKVKILISKEWRFRIGNIYGVYFNPTLKEYCLLFDVSLNVSLKGKQPYPCESSTPKPPVTYKMLTLGPRPCLRDIRNPYKDRYTYRSRDLPDKRPAIVDCFLYWLIEREDTHYYGDIMEFDTRTDGFRLMSCPAPMTDYGRFGLDLLNIDGFLSLVQIVAHLSVVKVYTWTLKDRASESWNFSQYDLAYKVYPLERGWRHFETIALRCGEMLIRSGQKLYVCNLEGGAAKVLGSKSYDKYSTFVSHDICLSSLNKCEPVIHIGNIKECKKCIKLEKKLETTSSNSAPNEH